MRKHAQNGCLPPSVGGPLPPGFLSFEVYIDTPTEKNQLPCKTAGFHEASYRQ